MDYQNLEDYSDAWIFRHRDMPLDEQALARIKPLTATAAHQFWCQHISREASHASHFLADDWPAKNGIWAEEKFNWQELWEGDDPQLPAELADHCDWDGNTVVYFCYHSEHVVQTDWRTFCAHWKNFLFYDEAPLLLGKKRKQVAQFFSDGSFAIGQRP